MLWRVHVLGIEEMLNGISWNRFDELLAYDPETGFLTWKKEQRGRKVGGRAGCVNARGYVYIAVYGQNLMAHRIAWFLVHKVPPTFVDHINRNPTDNRLCNLRLCNKTQNNGNAKLRKDNISGYRGVSWIEARNVWIARIRANGRNIYLGTFRTPEAAARAYDNAAYDYFGEFAATNFEIDLFEDTPVISIRRCRTKRVIEAERLLGLID
jgi:hypothetical protein